MLQLGQRKCAMESGIFIQMAVVPECFEFLHSRVWAQFTIVRSSMLVTLCTCKNSRFLHLCIAKLLHRLDKVLQNLFFFIFLSTSTMPKASSLWSENCTPVLLLSISLVLLLSPSINLCYICQHNDERLNILLLKLNCCLSLCWNVISHIWALLKLNCCLSLCRNTICHIWALLKLNCCPSLCWNMICHIWIYFPCFQLTLIWTFKKYIYLPFRDVFFYCSLFEAFEMSKFLMMFLSVIFICYHSLKHSMTFSLK